MTFGEVMDNGPAIREAARRARALVDKLIPETSAHGWQDPLAFVNASRRRKARDYFYLGAFGAFLAQTGAVK
jgi:hypothetical protein